VSQAAIGVALALVAVALGAERVAALTPAERISHDAFETDPGPNLTAQRADAMAAAMEALHGQVVGSALAAPAASGRIALTQSLIAGQSDFSADSSPAFAWAWQVGAAGGHRVAVTYLPGGGPARVLGPLRSALARRYAGFAPVSAGIVDGTGANVITFQGITVALPAGPAYPAGTPALVTVIG